MDFTSPGFKAGSASLVPADEQDAVGREIVVTWAGAIGAGEYVAGIGIRPDTRILRIHALGGDRVAIVLSFPTTHRLRAGDRLMIGVSDDTPAFVAAIAAANRLPTSSVIFVPRGNYILASGTIPVTYGGTTWEIDPGAAIFGSELPGFWGKLDFAGGNQGLALGRNDVAEGNSNLLYLSQDIGNTGTVVGIEKNVLNIDCTEGDSRGPIRTSDLTRGNVANVNTACIGIHAEVRLGNAVHGGTIWASQYNLQIPPGTDGYAVAFEYGIENNGSYSEEIGLGASKVGIKAICAGPQDCTTADEYETAGGRFHMFERFYQPALRPDGWAWIYEAVGYAPLADVDYRGNLYAQSLRGADVVVAALPTVCQPGQIVHATDGRKPYEAAGQGSGVDVECELAHKGGIRTRWYSIIGGLAISQ